MYRPLLVSLAATQPRHSINLLIKPTALWAHALGLRALWGRSFDLPDFEHVRRTVSVANQRLRGAFIRLSTGAHSNALGRCLLEMTVHSEPPLMVK